VPKRRLHRETRDGTDQWSRLAAFGLAETLFFDRDLHHVARITGRGTSAEGFGRPPSPPSLLFTAKIVRESIHPVLDICREPSHLSWRVRPHVLVSVLDSATAELHAVQATSGLAQVMSVSRWDWDSSRAKEPEVWMEVPAPSRNSLEALAPWALTCPR
jgi:hypothetical protein